MDSPQAQKDPLAITLSILFLTFPILCLICAFLSPICNAFKYNMLAIVFGVLPLVQAVGVISSIILFGKD